MSGYDITCTRCKAPVDHTCVHSEDHQVHQNLLVAAFIELFNWRPEGGLPLPAQIVVKIEVPDGA
tara:strand:- start:39 stop:233 length:195 start_codon:yes stop_codon:yes gene_type:complete